MKRHMVFAFLVAVLGLVSGCTSAPQKSNTEGMIAAANELDKAFVAAFNRGDAEALASLYWNSPDVVSFQPDTLQARGLAEIKEAFAKSFTAVKGAKIEITESHQMPAGDVVIGWGLFRTTIPAADGKTTEMVGRYTDVKTQRDGKWVYLMDHGSAPLPPPPAR